MSEFSPYDRILELHKYVENYYRQIRLNNIGNKNLTNPQPFDYIQHASQAFLKGAIPNPDALLFITLAFDKYIRSEGKLSLDEAFELKSKPKAGNPSRIYASTNKRNNDLFEMAWFRATNPKVSIEEAACKICENDPDLKNVPTLIREYSRKQYSEKIEPLIKRHMATGK